MCGGGFDVAGWSPVGDGLVGGSPCDVGRPGSKVFWDYVTP